MKERYQIIQGKSEQKLKDHPDNSVDSIVTDPPYELGFMGKEWDNSGIAYSVSLWRECLRVLKPGGHLLSFGGTRTYHRMACAIEDAGFEIRDQIQWIYGSGFPKSHNLKDEFEGWGTALKPAHEPICMARKPFKGTVLNNVLKYRTGAINIKDCRIGDGDIKTDGRPSKTEVSRYLVYSNEFVSNVHNGRWPTNILHDGSDEVLSQFPDATGQLAKSKNDGTDKNNAIFGKMNHSTIPHEPRIELDKSAARFFYCAKASKSDREEGLKDFENKITTDGRNVSVDNAYLRGETERKNNHPTVKPTLLMRYLCRLITPEGGTVLDPFAGSGSTGKAAILEGFNCILIEMTAEYIPIIEARCKAALPKIIETKPILQKTLF